MSKNIQHEDVLAHYGILGMKWGIRRFQPYPKGNGPKGNYVGEKPSRKIRKENKESIKKAVKDDHRGGVHLGQVRIAKGTTLQRVSSRESDDREGLYASYRSDDNKEYLTEIFELNQKRGKDKTYKIDMTAKVDLIAPDKKERIDIIMNDIMSKESNITEVNRLNSAQMKFIRENKYNEFFLALDRSPQLRQELSDALKDRGYNMIVDDNNTGAQWNGRFKAPVFVVDTPNTLEIKSSQEYTFAYKDGMEEKKKKFIDDSVKTALREEKLDKTWIPALREEALNDFNYLYDSEIWDLDKPVMKKKKKV